MGIYGSLHRMALSLLVGVCSLVLLAMLAHTSKGAPIASTTLLISEALYDGSQTSEGDEFVEIYNMTAGTIDLVAGDYKLGDEETSGQGEGMYRFPSGATIGPGAFVVIAKNADAFNTRFGFLPDYEFAVGGDNATVPNMVKYTTWTSGSFGLANEGDEVLLLDASDSCVDGMRYGNSTFAGCNLSGTNPTATDPNSLHRLSLSSDTDDMSDFTSRTPTPGEQPTAVTLGSFAALSGTTKPSLQMLLWTMGWVGLGSYVLAIRMWRRRRA